MMKRFEKWGTTEIIQDKRYAWSLEKICDYLNENFDKIADLEAKLAEKEHSIEILNQHLTDKTLEVEKADRMFRDCEADRKFEQEKKNIALKRVSELTKKLAEKEDEIEKLNNKIASNSKWLKLLDKQFVQIRNHNQDKIELLEKGKRKNKMAYL